MAHAQIELQSSDALSNHSTMSEVKDGEHESELMKKSRRASSRSMTEKPLLCKDILLRESTWLSLDSNEESGTITDSEPVFTSDEEAWSDDDEDSSEDSSVLCLTSHGARPLETTDSLRPSLPRRLSFKPLEKVVEGIIDAKFPEHTELAITPIEPGPSPSIIIAEASPGEMFHNEYFHIAKTESAGWGAFAAKDLKYGDRILYEKPLIVANFRTLFEEYENLDRSRKDVAMSLHANELCKPGTPKLQAIWTTNCFAVSKVGGVSGLFPIAARFNHACNPSDNIGYIYDEFRGCLEMFVKADKIAAGEELNISYGPRRSPVNLYLTYGFRCHCKSCPGVSDVEVDQLNDPW